jgi:farnesyl-diphosphate farnesyltransferase
MASTSQPASAERLDDLLLKTSRTFALSIPVLPQPTRREVTVAYLLFRIADTLEDATDWEPSLKLGELDAFGALLRGGPVVDATGLAARWREHPPLENPGYLELLSDLPAVLEAFESLADTARELVRVHTLRTVERMSDFVRRTRDDRGLELTDVDELRDYCYAVAGIVGEMLTELFLVGCPRLDSIAPSLRASAAKFGEALQLVNILKDSASDANEGRRYLPAAVDRGEVFALARGDLDDARRYVLDLQRNGAPHGMVAFTALPVLLARNTLDRVERDGPGAKLTRSEVFDIARRLDQALSRDDPAVP